MPSNLVFIDSFDDRTTVAYKWDSGTAPGSIAAGGRTGNCLLFAYGTNEIKKNLPRMKAFYCGIAVKPHSVNAAHQFLNFYDSVTGGNAQIALRLETSLVVTVLNRAGASIGSSSPQALTDETWTYLEFYGYIDDSQGAFELRMNGIAVATGSSIDTKGTNNAWVDQVGLLASSNSIPYVDDLYVATDQFYGGLKVYALLPASAGSLTGFSATTSDNYQCVDEANPNDDFDYVYSSGTSSEDLYRFAGLTDSATPYGVQLWTRHDRDGAVIRKFTPQCKSVNTDSSFAEVTTSESTYDDDLQWMNIDPATGTAWTVAGLNSAQFGIKITV